MDTEVDLSTTVIFDLDDTLFPEIDYVKGGFQAVSAYLSQISDRDRWFYYDRLMGILHDHGRGRVFDILLEQIQLYSETLVRMLVYIYRTHTPKIQMFSGAGDFIGKLKSLGSKIGIITDGLGTVQNRKLASLGLESMVDLIICTNDIGSQYGKPSIVPFKIALALLDAASQNTYYIGDNVEKDFAGANRLGINTIQITIADRRRKSFRIPVDPIYGAQHVAGNYDEIYQIIVKGKYEKNSN
jgi:putative hydrolase of the HAD superfamily